MVGEGTLHEECARIFRRNKGPRDPADLDGAPGAVEIKDGDVVSCRIDGFEPLSNPVVRR